MSNEILITALSSLIAAASFIAFAYPYLNKTERREKYRDIIEQKKRDLFIQVNVEKSSQKTKKSVSAKDSLTSFYNLQKLAGNMGEKARDKMLQAGNRSLSAPMKFMLSKLVMPILFCLIAMFFINASSKEISETMTLLVLFGSSIAGFKLPDLLIENQIQKRQQEINLAFPDALDIMLVCVQGGIGLEQTIERVADEISEHSPTLAEELGILSAEMAMLSERSAALQDFSRRVGGGSAKSFSSALIQAEQYGTSVSQAMRVLSDEMRDMRMANAEQKAASLPPKLTVPMILFFLPALFVIILGPAGIQATSQGLGG